MSTLAQKRTDMELTELDEIVAHQTYKLRRRMAEFFMQCNPELLIDNAERLGVPFGNALKKNRKK